jgi:hypothetical protein
MKVRKAIKKIAALSAGATMIGATLMGGAMAADLSDYPNMFIEDGQFDGLLVIGRKADITDTIGVTNVALGLQKAAVTKTIVCGDSSGGTTTVTGEQVQLRKPGDDLNLKDELYDVQSTSLDDSDLPTILAEGEFKDNEGDNKEDVEYEQKIDLLTGTGTVDYYYDKDDADPSGVYLKLDKGDDVYNYLLEFNSDLEYADAADLESTTIMIQGATYTITDVNLDGSDHISEMTLMSGESVMWIEQDETVTKTIGGVDHTITMLDVTSDEESCGFDVDGTTVWIDDDETQTVGGLTIGVTDAKAVYTKDYDKDICKVFIGAAELKLTEANNDAVEIGGEEVEGSGVTFTDDVSGTEEIWESMLITYDPEDNIYLAPGDEWVDPVFGNFKIIVGDVVVDNEEIELEVSGSDGTISFISYDDKEIEIPFVMDDTDTGSLGPFYLGTDKDLGANPDEGYYVEGAICNPDSGDVEDCVGAHFIGVTDGDVIHIVEVSSIDSEDNEIKFRDITYGNTETTVDDYTNDAISIRGGLGTVDIDIDVGETQITFTDIDMGDIKTKNEGILTINMTTAATNLLSPAAFTFTENDDATTDTTVLLYLNDNDDEDEIQISAPSATAGTLYGGSSVKLSEDDDKVHIYYTQWGTMYEYDSDNDDYITISHPEEELYLEVFVAEAAAITTSTETTEEGCVVSEKINPISTKANKFDTDITNPTAQNVIAVGGPCANSVAAALLGNPEECAAGFEEGKAMIKLVENGGNVALIVAGYSGKDTMLAARIMQEYEKYDLSGSEMVATTVSETGLKVEPVTTA